MDGFIEGVTSEYKGYKIICFPSFENEKKLWTAKSTILKMGLPTSHGFYFEAVREVDAINACRALSEGFIDTLTLQNT